MPVDVKGSRKIAFGSGSEQAAPAALAMDVNKGLVFMRPAAVEGPAYTMQLETELHGSWLVLTNAEAEAVEEEFVDSGRSFSVGVDMEASAFGCDSNVLERAVSRLLEKAAANSLDCVEITEVRRHHDSVLDYVTILALGRTTLQKQPWNTAGQAVNSAA